MEEPTAPPQQLGERLVKRIWPLVTAALIGFAASYFTSQLTLQTMLSDIATLKERTASNAALILEVQHSSQNTKEMVIQLNERQDNTLNRLNEIIERQNRLNERR